MMKGLSVLGAIPFIAAAAGSHENACQTALWAPRLGDDVYDALDMLDIDLQTFQDYNDEFSEVGTISVTQTFQVPYKSSLPTNAWTTKGNTCFLQVNTCRSNSPPRNNSEANVTMCTCDKASVPHNQSTTTTIQKTAIHTNHTTRNEATAKYQDVVTTTLHLDSARPTEAVPAKCGIDRELSLQCHDKNDGSYVTDEAILKDDAQEICAKASGKLIAAGDDPLVFLYSGDNGNQLLFQIYRITDCTPTTKATVRKKDECACLFWHSWKDCTSNGGTGGRLRDTDTCLEYYYSPKKGNRVPAYDIGISERAAPTRD